METVRVRARVRGRVQGVWFRASTREEAERAGLAGGVRNLPDGSVELEAEGAREAVDQLIAWCHHGPPAAQVDAVDVETIEPTGRAAGFSIRH